jgi:hypothetical protein
MTTEIEDRVRAALQAGAAAITDDAKAPAQVWDGGPATRSPARRLHRTRWAWLAAAACVAAVAALAVGLRGGGHSAPPATSQSPSISPSPSRTVPSDPNAIHPASCAVTLPDAWQQAFTTGRVPSPGASQTTSAGLPILAMTPSGDVVSATATVPQRLVLVRPDRSIQTLYTAPRTIPGQGDAEIAGQAQADSGWVVFGLDVRQGEASLDGIYAVDTKTRQVRTIRSTDLGTLPIVSPPVLLGGRVYWSEGLSVGPTSMYQYDLASGVRTTLDTGQVITWPATVGGGLFWMNGSTTVEHVHATLPPGYVVHPTKANVLLQDGGTQAWVGSNGQRTALEMTTAEHPTPMIAFTAPTSDTVLTPLALARPYLIWSDANNITVLDTRTGATANLLPTGGLHLGIDSAAAAGGTIALTQTGAKGGAQLSVVNSVDLPELRC